MSQNSTSTPWWDARLRLADLADHSRPADDLEVTATEDPELFEFRTRAGRVEGFARVVEVDAERRCSVIAVIGGTSTSSWSAAFQLVDHAVELVSDGPADGTLLDSTTTTAWLEALTARAGADGDRVVGRDTDPLLPADADVTSAGVPDASDTGGSGVVPGTSRTLLVAVSGAAAFALVAIAWWRRSAGSAGARARG